MDFFETAGNTFTRIISSVPFLILFLLHVSRWLSLVPVIILLIHSLEQHTFKY